MIGRPELSAVLAATLLVLAGCGGDDEHSTKGAPVEIRTVVTSSHLDGGCHATTAACDAWADFTCPAEPEVLDDDLLMACGTGDESDQPYLLAAPAIVGGVESADAVHRERIDQWEVEVRLDSDATARFAALTAELVPTYAPIGIVLDGVVLSAPAVQTQVTNGVVRLAGDYTEEHAEALADELTP